MSSLQQSFLLEEVLEPTVCITLTSSARVGVTVVLIYNLVIVSMHSQVIKFNWAPTAFSKYFSQENMHMKCCSVTLSVVLHAFGIVSGNYFVEIKGQVFTTQNNTFPLVNEIWFRAAGGKRKLVINSFRVWWPVYMKWWNLFANITYYVLKIHSSQLSADWTSKIASSVWKMLMQAALLDIEGIEAVNVSQA